MPEPRRSGRQRKVNPRYANGGWDKDTLRRLRADSESSGSSPAEESIPSDSDEGDAAKHVSAQEEDDASLASVASIQSSDVETPDQGNDEDGNVHSTSDENIPSRKRRGQPSRPRSAPAAELTRSRGLQPPSQLGKRAAYAKIFGPEIDDLFEVLTARDTWLKGQDITVPTRQTLFTAIQQIDDFEESNNGSNEESPREKEDAFAVESLFETVHTRQVLKVIDLEAIHEKYLLHRVPEHSVVLGPWGKQNKFGIDYLSSLDTGKAWLDDGTTEGVETSHTGEQPAQASYHQAWLINVGEKVQCLAWAVGNTHSVQYLAVAVKCTSSQRRMVPYEKERERPAFHPSPAYPTSIQIWAFHTRPTDIEKIRNLAIDEEPSLVMVIGTEWGNIRQLKWCQLEPADDTNQTNSVNPTIGLLAAVSSDGHARIIAVPRPKDRKKGIPVTLRVERAGFDIPPPADTIFTTLEFADPTNFLLGTADGFLYCFDLTELQSQEGLPKCYMKQRLHHTYVLSVCAGAPGAQSTFLASTSASGDLALTDLRSPEHDQVHVPRPSFPTRDLIYAPFTRSFIAVLDRSGNTQVERNAATFLVCHHIRQFPNLSKIAKLPHDTGATTALAGSQWHPCILVGNAKGQVLATNYLRKVLPYRKTDPKKAVGAYLQKICEYDWRPLTAEEQYRETNPSSPSVANSSEAGKEEEATTDLYHGHDTRPGVSRFHEGFKPEKIEVAYSLPTVKKSSRPRKTPAGGTGAGEAVFEEEQAVTALAWNPNAACAGVAAMGWGSGIVRVQDLAYDMPPS
ncbi:hypothetical protein AYO21_00408 [Fonsecaea monophora]|uniref:Uncharacterized protein n=1 Tax=Fonsecaea monophora TaxID=254056 RepID=A0A177FNB0_9EURO|nr:hypothetical protein AYO21_00408 [Fonsecaea monophora]KAH0828455.1 hypothetical protein FOPE_01500 [Fonsecaea pedrosoi]OAG45060.1 hypothetical protein AYO21_00408 [Fonsecaea monophora]